MTKRVGLALGGGGVRGVAHVGVLELLDRRGVRPSAIAGCSMGAVIGALYAAGMTGKDIHALIRQHVVGKDDTIRDLWEKGASLIKWVTSVVPEIHRGGLINADRFLMRILGPVATCRFDELEIPLSVVATDYWKAEQVVIREGDVMSAVRASMAAPGIFRPVVREGRVLVDGGLVNQVPYDLLPDDCDVTIAVDVVGARPLERTDTPGAFEAMLGAFDMLQGAALSRRLEDNAPDILIRKQIRDVGFLDFNELGGILEQRGLDLHALESGLDETLG